MLQSVHETLKFGREVWICDVALTSENHGRLTSILFLLLRFNASSLTTGAVVAAVARACNRHLLSLPSGGGAIHYSPTHCCKHASFSKTAEVSSSFEQPFQ